jgi:hypothetical protein
MMSQEELERYFEAREILAHRKLAGTVLTKEELLALQMLNDRLEAEGIVAWG